MGSDRNRFSRRNVLAGTAGSLVALTLPAYAQQKTNLRFGHQYPIDHPVAVGIEKASQVIAQRSDGRIKLTVYPTGQLGTGKEIDQQVSDNSLDFSIDGPGIVGNWHRPLSIFEAPFLAKDWAQLVKIKRSAAGGRG